LSVAASEKVCGWPENPSTRHNFKVPLQISTLGHHMTHGFSQWRLVRALGLLIGGWFSVWPGFASASDIVILDGLGLPVHMAEVHGRVLSALEAAAARSGRTVVKAMGPGWCTSVECFRQVAAGSSATEIMAVSGERTDSEGWRLAIEVRSRDGALRAARTGGCDICSGSELVMAVGDLATGVLSPAQAYGDPNAAQPALPAAGALVNSPGLALPAGGAPVSGNHLMRNVALAGAGALGVAAGGILWWFDGRRTDCEADPLGPTVCPAGYRTAAIGVPVMIAGAALALAGVVLIVREHGAQAAQLAIGPGAMRLEAKF
jgi:hypothetical protein